MRTRCQYPYHLVLPTGRHTTPCCGMDTCAWIPVFLIVLVRCFEFYFSCFVEKNFIEVKCKEYNSTQWVCCRVAQLCLSMLKGVDYQTTTAKVIQFTF